MLRTWLEALRAWPLIFDPSRGLSEGALLGSMNHWGPVTLRWRAEAFQKPFRLTLPAPSPPPAPPKAACSPWWLDTGHHSLCILVGAKSTWNSSAPRGVVQPYGPL